MERTKRSLVLFLSVEEKGKTQDSTGRLKDRGSRERHAPAKPRLVAVLRSKLRFSRFLQVPTGSHCLSLLPLSFRLLAFRALDCSTPHASSLSQVLTGSHCLSLFPLSFRLLAFSVLDCSTPPFLLPSLLQSYSRPVFSLFPFHFS